MAHTTCGVFHIELMKIKCIQRDVKEKFLKNDMRKAKVKWILQVLVNQWPRSDQKQLNSINDQHWNISERGSYRRLKKRAQEGKEKWEERVNGQRDDSVEETAEEMRKDGANEWFRLHKSPSRCNKLSPCPPPLKPPQTQLTWISDLLPLNNVQSLWQKPRLDVVRIRSV